MHEATQISPSSVEEPTSRARDAEPATNQPATLALRRAERQQQYLEAKLADPDPKNAVLGSLALEALEFTPLLKSAMLEVAAACEDPTQRLQTLLPGIRLYSAVLRMAEKLT